MKKRNLKKWVKELIVVITIFIIGLGFMLILSERVNQIDNNKGVSYEKYN
jgi:Tfp pilus assembly protein PilO